METYLVGGTVRDELLGLPIRERDWVVVGATPQEMLRLGYRQVGRDFPVFLHAETHEEYALARTERKVAPGHTGFVCHAGPEVTLEDDLRRRDLTINAMARATDGTLIDPWGGRADLAARRLRHVSPAFAEDPLRVFRVARFAAWLAPLGFEVADETLALMLSMAATGALRELAAERVWAELTKALSAAAPAEFFAVLTRAGALGDWFPEVAAASFESVAALLTRVSGRLEGPVERYGALGSVLSGAAARTLSERLKGPREASDLILAVARFVGPLSDYRRLEPEDLLRTLKALDVLRRRTLFERTVQVIGAATDRDLDGLRSLGAAMRDVRADAFRERGLEGKALGAALDGERLAVIRRTLGVNRASGSSSPSVPPSD